MHDISFPPPSRPSMPENDLQKHRWRTTRRTYLFAMRIRHRFPGVTNHACMPWPVRVVRPISLVLSSAVTPAQSAATELLLHGARFRRKYNIITVPSSAGRRVGRRRTVYRVIPRPAVRPTALQDGQGR